MRGTSEGGTVSNGWSEGACGHLEHARRHLAAFEEVSRNGGRARDHELRRRLSLTAAVIKRRADQTRSWRPVERCARSSGSLRVRRPRWMVGEMSYRGVRFPERLTSSRRFGGRQLSASTCRRNDSAWEQLLVVSSLRRVAGPCQRLPSNLSEMGGRALLRFARADSGTA
jgi:hypothetical protein